MDYTKNYLRKVCNEVIEESERKGYLGIVDVRKLTGNGIPAAEIAVRNIPIECFKKGLEVWLDGLEK